MAGNRTQARCFSGGVMLLKAIYKIHRWGGVAVAVLMVTWLLSGLVILYAGQITQGRTAQLAHAQSLDIQPGWLSVGEAWVKTEAAHPGAGIAGARLLRTEGEPTWLVTDLAGKVWSISAINGQIQTFSPLRAEQIAQQWLLDGEHISGEDVLYEDTQDAPNSLRNYWDLKPFFRVGLHDLAGTELLISARTGEVLQAATRLDRGLYYAGSWLHFFRFLDTPTSGDTRRNVLLWTVFVAGLASISGLIIGYLRWRPGFFGRPTYGNGKTQPYGGFMLKWHFWGGLIGGTMAILWTVSGYLNTNPGQIFAPAAVGKSDLARFGGQEQPAALLSWQPAAVKAAGDVVEVAWTHLGNRAVLVAYGRDGQRWPQTVAGAAASLEPGGIADAARHLVKEAAVADVAVLTAYDAYYYPYHNRDPADKPLPVVRVQLDDADHTWAYVDAVDGRLLARLDSSRRAYRWLFSGVHRWDLPGLYVRPLWDVWQLTWIGFGLALSLTSLVLAWRWLRRKYQIVRFRLVGEELAESPSIPAN